MTKTQQQWRNRIVGHGEMPASEFLANPLNWRIHPQFQQEAMAGALNEIGWIDEVTVNTRTGRIVDGHLRVTLALRAGDNTPVPYKEVDLSEEEEALALASKDPIAALAVTDNAQYLALLDGVSSGEAALQQLLDSVAQIELPTVEDDAPNLDPGDGRYKEQYGVIVICESEQEQERVYTALRDQGYTCRVVVT